MKPYFQDDACTIWHGDARTIVPTLGRFDLLLTDPPYGLGKKLSGGSWGDTNGGGFSWDKSIPNLDACISTCNDAIIWGGNYFPLQPSRCWLVWSKPNAVPTMADCDLAWTTFNRPTKRFTYGVGLSTESGDHPTPKPIALMLWCLSFAPTAQTILDPFMGSGTTLRAAKDLGRKSVGIELEERYCEIAARRLQQQVLNLA